MQGGGGTLNRQWESISLSSLLPGPERTHMHPPGKSQEIHLLLGHEHLHPELAVRKLCKSEDKEFSE